MRKHFVAPLFALALVVGLGPARAQAQFYDTVNWVPKTTADGMGSGTLKNGSIAVTYTTAVGAHSNSGFTYPINWNTSLATAAGVGMGVNHLLAGTLGENPGAPQVNTVTFSATVTNPIFLLTFADADSTYNFGAIPITFLSSHNAQLAAGVVTFLGAGDSVNDGFAAQLIGTFGPSNPLTFLSTALTSESQTFTVGLAIVPEPSSLVLIGTVFLPLAGASVWMRRRRKVA